MTAWLRRSRRAPLVRSRFTTDYALGLRVNAKYVVLIAAAVAMLFLGTVSRSHPPGFYRDESNIAFNAASIAASDRDEHGAFMPLYFRSFGDWKSAPYIYLLAGVFKLAGPSQLAARALSAALVLVAVLLLGLLALLLSKNRLVALATMALAAATPWFFDVSRLVFEVALEPALLAALLVLLATVRDADTWSLGRCVALGVTLALIAYGYAGGRALAPLLAAALVVFVTRDRWRSVVYTWFAFAIALIPMAVVQIRHPGSLLSRYHHVSATAGDSLPAAGANVAANAFRALNLWRWSTAGDSNPRHHAPGTGSLLVVGGLLALAGLVILIRSRRLTAFWQFVLLGAVASVFPAAIADIPIHALRAIALPVFLTTLAVPAIELLSSRPLAATAVLIVAFVQLAFFQASYWHDGRERRAAFEAEFPALFRAASRAGAPIVVYRHDPEALGNAQWYGELWHVPIRIVESDKATPARSVLLASELQCSGCRRIEKRGIFTAYRTPPFQGER
ncbi:MAG: hypothetical protein ACJ74R_13610 [Gaiellaceae bacterium]